MRTQVAIVGAGPAGLLLSHLLRPRGHRLGRARGPQPRLRRAAGARRRARARHGRAPARQPAWPTGCDREGLVHHGVELRFDGEGHRIALSELTGGRAITIYGQQEVVKDLIAARLRDGGDAALRGRRRARSTTSTPTRRRSRFTPRRRRARAALRRDRRLRRLPRRLPRRRPRRASSPSTSATYPFAWLGILAEAAAVVRGADLHAPRARLRPVQPALAAAQPAVPAGAPRTRTSTTGPTSAIWEELRTRTGDPGRLRAQRGPGGREGHRRRCAASSSSRCSTAGCSWPATPPTSSRPPAPRA